LRLLYAPLIFAVAIYYAPPLIAICHAFRLSPPPCRRCRFSLRHFLDAAAIFADAAIAVIIIFHYLFSCHFRLRHAGAVSQRSPPYATAAADFFNTFIFHAFAIFRCFRRHDDAASAVD